MAAVWCILLYAFSCLPTPIFAQHPDGFFYEGFKAKGAAAKNLTLTEAAEVQVNGVLRLTNDSRRVMGHAFYSSPFRFKPAGAAGPVSSFSASFAFAIVPEYPRLGGHGFAFAISPSTSFRSANPSQYLGLLNNADMGNFSNHLFAVEFDTAKDLEFLDINDNHVGVDINSLVSNQSAAAAYYDDDQDSIRKDLNLTGGRKILAWVDYDSKRRLLNVTISPESTKPRVPLLSWGVDLSPVFLEKMYVGFSASTGVLASSHYIFGWSFKINGEAQALDLSSLPSLPGPKKQYAPLIIGVSVSSILIAASAIGFAIFLAIKIRNAEGIEDWELQMGPHRFSYEELKRATKGFRDKHLLGSGGFGSVYRGQLQNPKIPIAVKRISHESKQGLREFVSEIATIGRLRHRNLVQLHGWCRRRGNLLLVYDFMPNGSLDKLVFGNPRETLGWGERFRVLNDVASALLYLHEGFEQVVIHRDVKASNVLLDGDLRGRLGDFGLARLSERGSNPSTTTRVVGTLGYLAPELPRTGKATEATDVYAFGALLLEVACGRRPIEPKAARPEAILLVDWVWDRWQKGRVLEAVDPKLNGQYDAAQAEAVLRLGLMCANDAPAARPSMRQVVMWLGGESDLPATVAPPVASKGDGGDGVAAPAVAHGSRSTTSSCEEETGSFAFTRNEGDVEDGSFGSISVSSPLPLLYS